MSITENTTPSPSAADWWHSPTSKKTIDEYLHSLPDWMIDECLTWTNNRAALGHQFPSGAAAAQQWLTECALVAHAYEQQTTTPSSQPPTTTDAAKPEPLHRKLINRILRLRPQPKAPRLQTQIFDLCDELATANCETAYTIEQLEHVMAELLMNAERSEQVSYQRAQDARQAAHGHSRVTCRWCDSEYYVHETEPEPNICGYCHIWYGY